MTDHKNMKVHWAAVAPRVRRDVLDFMRRDRDWCLAEAARFRGNPDEAHVNAVAYWTAYAREFRKGIRALTVKRSQRRAARIERAGRGAKR